MLLFAVFLSAGSVSWVCMCVRFMTMTCFPCITSAHIFLFRPFLSLTPISLFVSSLVLTDISFATKMRFCFMWCSEQKHHFWLRQNKKNRPELMNGFELPFFFVPRWLLLFLLPRCCFQLHLLITSGIFTIFTYHMLAHKFFPDKQPRIVQIFNAGHFIRSLLRIKRFSVVHPIPCFQPFVYVGVQWTVFTISNVSKMATWNWG